MTSTGTNWTSAAPPAYASLQAGLLTNPTGTAAGSPGVMMGYGVGNTITPTSSGKILVTIAGTILNSTAAKSSVTQIRYGTGTPPANGAAGTAGTALGAQPFSIDNAANGGGPFCVTGVITGAAIGTALWFDLALWSAAAGTASTWGVSITAVELP